MDSPAKFDLQIMQLFPETEFQFQIFIYDAGFDMFLSGEYNAFLYMSELFRISVPSIAPEKLLIPPIAYQLRSEQKVVVNWTLTTCGSYQT